MKWPWSKSEPVYSEVGKALWSLLHDLEPVYRSGWRIHYPSRQLTLEAMWEYGFGGGGRVLVVSDSGTVFAGLTTDDQKRLYGKIVALVHDHTQRNASLDRVAGEQWIRETLGLDHKGTP